MNDPNPSKVTMMYLRAGFPETFPAHGVARLRALLDAHEGGGHADPYDDASETMLSGGGSTDVIAQNAAGFLTAIAQTTPHPSCVVRLPMDHRRYGVAWTQIRKVNPLKMGTAKGLYNAVMAGVSRKTKNGQEAGHSDANPFLSSL